MNGTFVATIRLNKPEAARRQIDAAIRLLFSGEDPAAIHTLAMAGFQILRDLVSKKNVSVMEQYFDAIIKPGMKGAFWSSVGSLANFLKHADRDPDKIHDGIEECANDAVLFVACTYYHDLGYSFTPEMWAMLFWFRALHPELFEEKADPRVFAAVEAVGVSIRTLPRKDQLAFGRRVLDLKRRSGDQFA